jgi:hypothetical protein
MSEVFRQLSVAIGSASAVRSIKRTAEVVPERQLVAEERKSDSGSSEVVSEDVRGVPLQPPPLLRLLRLEAGGYRLERDGGKGCGLNLTRCRRMFSVEFH